MALAPGTAVEIGPGHRGRPFPRPQGSAVCFGLNGWKVALEVRRQRGSYQHRQGPWVAI